MDFWTDQVVLQTLLECYEWITMESAYTSHIKASHLKSLIQSEGNCQEKLSKISELVGLPGPVDDKERVWNGPLGPIQYWNKRFNSSDSWLYSRISIIKATVNMGEMR